MAVIDLDAVVRDVVCDRLGVVPERLTVDCDLTALGLEDEDTGTSVLVGVEDVLDVRFPDDFLDGVRTYGDLTTAVKAAVGG